MSCRCGGTVVEVKVVGRGMRAQQCDRCGRRVGLPYSLASRRALLRQRGRMQRDAERQLAGQGGPRPRAVKYGERSRSGWTPDMATPRGERE